MPDPNDNENVEGDETQDPIKQLKGEFARKMANSEKELQKLASTNAQLLAGLSAIEQRLAPKPKEQEVEELDPYSPDFVEKVTAKAASAAVNAVNKVNSTEQARQQVIGQLVQQYPELTDNSSKLHQRAVQIFDSMSPEERATAAGYRAAVLQAANEEEIKPMSKRKRASEEDDESFTMSSSSSRGASDGSRDRNKKTTKLSEATKEFAKLMGLNMNDEKQVKSLEKRAQRTKWNRYE